MSSDKYITYIYKILTKEDKLKLFVGSTKEKLHDLLQYFIRNCNSNKTNNLYQWIRPLHKSNLQIKLIKSYPVSNKDEQKKREKYWIRKYTDYGYNVIHNPVKKIDEPKTNTKIYICLQNVSMAEIISQFGDKIVSISKEEIQSSHPPFQKNSNQPPPPPPLKRLTFSTSTSKPVKQSVSSGGYMSELSNILNRRNSSGLSISELTNKKTPPKKLKLEKNKDEPYDNILDELKATIKLV